MQLTVTGTYADRPAANLTARTTGTQYLISNPAFATVSPDGLVTARQSGTVIIQAVNEGRQGLLQLTVALSRDSDADGIPDDAELRMGLNPNNPADALDDPDHDGLTNLQEFKLGTDHRNPDTDGDGIPDGEEVKLGTNPLSKDTDGDGIPDNVEIATGSDPKSAASGNLGKALQSITVTPATFLVNVNSIGTPAFQQLQVTGQFILGAGTINLTGRSRGTNYNSSDPKICNFGAEDGRVFAGTDGTCTITITNSGFTATASGIVQSFTPRAISHIAIPGYANNVDAAGSYVYVAAGATGLQVVSVSDPSNPQIVGSIDTPGNANDVRIVGNLAFVADGSAGLRIINVTNPANPLPHGAFDTAGDAMDLMVFNSRAYVADGAGGLAIIDVTNAAAPSLLKQVAVAGTTRGVDVLQGPQAKLYAIVVADAPSVGLRVIDVTDPAKAAVVASLPLNGAPKDVRVNGNLAYIAAYTGGMQIVDLTNPLTPTALGSLPSQIVPRDVEVAGQFALLAEQLFPNVVPIVDVSNPSNPILRATIDFLSHGDYAGTGIAINGPYFYMTGEQNFVTKENGDVGDTRLFIGQYLPLEDRGGVPPQIALTSPSGGASVIRGSTISLRANARDDVAVVAVTFIVNGEEFTDTSAPYEALYTVPPNATTLSISARAIDLGKNGSSTVPITVTAIADPLTTVRGTVIDRLGAPVVGAAVVCLTAKTTSGTGGAFSIGSVPTIRGDVQCSATHTVGAQTLTGISGPTAPVPGGVTNVGQIIVNAHSSRGRDFWLAHQAVYKPGAQIIVLSDVAANVSIASAGFNQSISVTPQSPAVVALPNSLQVTTNQIVENKGIRVTSDQDVTVLLYLSAAFSADIALAIPTPTLGTEYFVVAYPEYLTTDGSPNVDASEFVITATQNNTAVSFSPRCTSVSGTTAGSNVSVVLQQGQTYQYQCIRADVTGTRITSDKPIGVIAGNRCAHVPQGNVACDVLSEAMFSVTTMYGTEFYSAPLPGSTSDIFRILAARNGTVVTVDQGASPGTYSLNQGQFQELRIEPGARFSSNQPISVNQYAVGVGQARIGDPFQMQLIPTHAYRDSFRLYSPPGFTQGTYAVVIAPTAAVASVTLNGTLVTGFVPLPGGAQHYRVIPVPVGQSVITAAQPIAVYGIGYLDAGSYGYPAGF